MKRRPFPFFVGIKKQPWEIGEWTLGILLTGLVLWLLWVRALHAGGLWRDEAAVLQLAQLPNGADILKYFHHEAFPPPFHFLIRGWTALFGSDDQTLRWFGLGVGVLLLAAVWSGALWLRQGPPLLTLALVGLNPTFLMWGTSLRGYGLGCGLILLSFSLIRKFGLTPTRGWGWATGIAALLSVQILLYNVVLLGVLVAVAAGGAFWWKRYRLAGWLLLMGGVAGASLGFYVTSYRKGAEWDVLVKTPVDLLWLWDRGSTVLGASAVWMIWVGLSIFVLALVSSVVRLVAVWGEIQTEERDALFYATGVIVGAPVAYFVFLKILSYPTHAWYYLALFAIMVAALETVVATLARFAAVRWARLVLVVLAAGYLPLQAWSVVTQLQSNIFLIAQSIQKEAQKNDLVVVSPWFYGVTYQHYQAAGVPWETVPPLSSHQFHRFDLVKRWMEEEDQARPVASLLESMRTTLQKGGRVFLVGNFPFVPPETPLFKLRAAPQTVWGWNEDPYLILWARQVADFVQKHGREASVGPLLTSQSVIFYENLPWVVVQGWRD